MNQGIQLIKKKFEYQKFRKKLVCIVEDRFLKKHIKHGKYYFAKILVQVIEILEA